MRILDALKMYEKRSKNDFSCKLMTAYGEQLDKNHVLTEYPRPNLVRDSYMNLNGYWDYKIIPDGFLSDSVFTLPSDFDGSILVPFSPECILSGVEKVVLPKDALWYHKKLQINSIKEHSRCILHFGAVDQICYLYVNGQMIRQHTGGYLPFSTDITDYIHTGENEIFLLVRDYTDSSYHSRGKQKLKNGGMFYQCQSGIWQTVWYEFVPDTYIKNLLIHSDFDSHTVWFDIDLSTISSKKDTVINNLCETTMDITVSFCGKTLISLQNAALSTRIKINDFYPWTPDTPNLYDVTIRIGKDFVQSYFAFRCIEIVSVDEPGLKNRNQIFLNHERFFMNGVLDQGYWPESLMTPPSYEAYEFDILTMKKAGFNMLRKHIKIEPLIFYYLCDKLGMLVWQDMVNGGTDYSLSVALSIPMGAVLSANHMSDRHYFFTARKSVDGRREWLSECKRTVKLLQFFPCITTWVPFNEGWGQFDAVKVTRMIQRIDPSRLIDHASGWFDQGVGNFKSEHNYFKKLKVHKDSKRAYVLSEFGGIVYRVHNHSFRNHTFGYQTCQSVEDFKERFQKLFEEIEQLKKDGLSACVYTQVSDIEEEMNGILTYDRKVKKM